MSNETNENVGKTKKAKVASSKRKGIDLNFATAISIIALPICYATIIIANGSIATAEVMKPLNGGETKFEMVIPTEVPTETTTEFQTATRQTTKKMATTQKLSEEAELTKIQNVTETKNVLTTEPTETEAETATTESTTNEPEETEEVTDELESEWWGGIVEGDSNYIMLCNAVAHEAGSDEVSEYNKGMVASVIINRVESSIYPGTIYDVLTQKNQFSGASGYIGLGGYSSKVNQSVKNAVSWYLSEGYKTDNHGYMSFWGDGHQNHFS